MSSSDEGTSRDWPKKKQYVHKYRSAWEEMPEFKCIRSSKKGENYFHCMVCGDDYLAGKSALKKHIKTTKHSKNSKSHANLIPANKMPRVLQQSSIKNKTSAAELRIAMFIVEHNIAHRTTDHLVSLIKTISSDCSEPDVINNIKCNRTKATALINNAVGSYGQEELVKNMNNQSFSILIDESTDKSSIKTLAIIVRLMDLNKFIVRDEFFSLTEITNGTAQGIYDAITNVFEKHNIAYKTNMVGFASDGANTMFGSHHSVKTLLQNDIPNLFVMKCICHSLALCASYASNKLPDSVENLVRDVYTYFKYSFKRQTEFKEFQVFVELKPHKLLQPSQTRWLSLHLCVKRILEQYSALKLYFQGQHLLDNKANEIFSGLSKTTNQLYLYFLDFVLPILVKLNVEFQSEKPQIHKLYQKMSSAFKSILECYIKPDYLNNTDVSKCQYRNPIHFVQAEDIYVGGKCAAIISEGKLSNSEKTIFYTNCLNFYVECACQIYKRFPFNSTEVSCLKTLQFLDSKQIKTIPSIGPAAKYFENRLNIDLNDIDREWRHLRNVDMDFDVDVSEFWKIVLNIKDGDNNHTFPLLNKLVSLVLILPHSSATVERLFSVINLNKTKIRNKLSTDTITGILHCKNVLKNQDKSCFNFDINTEIIKKMNSSIYDK